MATDGGRMPARSHLEIVMVETPSYRALRLFALKNVSAEAAGDAWPAALGMFPSLRLEDKKPPARGNGHGGVTGDRA
jgi:hypothetical protein